METDQRYTEILESFTKDMEILSGDHPDDVIPIISKDLNTEKTFGYLIRPQGDNNKKNCLVISAGSIALVKGGERTNTNDLINGMIATMADGKKAIFLSPDDVKVTNGVMAEGLVSVLATSLNADKAVFASNAHSNLYETEVIQGKLQDPQSVDVEQGALFVARVTSDIGLLKAENDPITSGTVLAALRTQLNA